MSAARSVSWRSPGPGSPRSVRRRCVTGRRSWRRPPPSSSISRPASASFRGTRRAERIPRFLRYLDRALDANPGGRGRWLVGRRLCYVDLSTFQVLAGLRSAFPRAMARHERGVPRLGALHDRVAALPSVAAYLASERRIPFDESGIFRHYPELDAGPALSGSTRAGSRRA